MEAIQTHSALIACVPSVSLKMIVQRTSMTVFPILVLMEIALMELEATHVLVTLCGLERTVIVSMMHVTLCACMYITSLLYYS